MYSENATEGPSQTFSQKQKSKALILFSLYVFQKARLYLVEFLRKPMKRRKA